VTARLTAYNKPDALHHGQFIAHEAFQGLEPALFAASRRSGCLGL